MPPNQMTKGDASRIQAGQAKAGGEMCSNGFSARAQSAGDRNSNVNVGTTKSSSGFGNAGIGGGQSGAGSGGGRAGAK
ncbi:hypothetical protein BGZ57DRAFT_928428 [Hyaloscypha finlandica]|nr:hypothetical protein BGZ57DRAFT_928428 [Hyaloscypha finlandica]